jgi:hypothetical protein
MFWHNEQVLERLSAAVNRLVGVEVDGLCDAALHDLDAGLALDGFRLTGATGARAGPTSITS